ncbi:MAG: hypothetical protein SGPRY_006802 [Prymnesium sp.]
MACQHVRYYAPSVLADPPTSHPPRLLSLEEDDSVCSHFPPLTPAGFARQAHLCVDLGVGSTQQLWRPLTFLPTHQPRPAAASLSRTSELFSLLNGLQFPAHHCDSPALHVFPIRTLPLIGFGQTLEYLNLALVLAAGRGSMLVLGQQSSLAWASTWYCGSERSLRCYFNVSACCGDATFNEGSLRTRKPLRKGAKFGELVGNHRALKLDKFNSFGTLWLTGQISQFVFSRMWPSVREALSRRRVAASIPRGQLDMIGMHVRRGDSCALKSRYCPTNMTEAYFLKASKLREAYGFNRIFMATDDPTAADMCRRGHLGFECHTMPMNRERFQAFTSIELRVAKQDRQCGASCKRDPLSGSELALDALADMDMLADCRCLVVNLRASMSRLALSMAVARRRSHVPFISVQWPWGGRSAHQ